jgi:CPA1 family monovalent cation:H+ antiporter
MAVFENVLLMLALACALLQVSRRMGVPYPSTLALAGLGVGALPWMTPVAIDPALALALFIAPALFDSAFDTAPRELRRNWLPLLSLVLVAVVLTTAAVAWVGVAFAGLPLAAAITLGAIVAPPDAVAAATVMKPFRLPRRTLSIINGESLLNDAVALLIFGVATSVAMAPGALTAGAADLSVWLHALPPLAIAVPGGAVFGYALGRVYRWIAPHFAGTRSAIILQFTATFAAWLFAERLHLSAILTIVAFGMTVARDAPARSSARDRIHSNAIWDAAVFILNVVAFFIMGLQARTILLGLSGPALWDALRFAVLVLAVVIGVRLAWVLVYGALVRRFHDRLVRLDVQAPSKRTGILVGWSGMRGLVTLATSFALPAQFPGRDLIVLSAFTVVLGTLVLQGFTIGPLIRRLQIKPDKSLNTEVAEARAAMLEAAMQLLDAEKGEAADAVREEYAEATRAAQRAKEDDHLALVTVHDQLRLNAIGAQRKVLARMRAEGEIEDDAYRHLQEELDLQELSATDSGEFRLASG